MTVMVAGTRSAHPGSAIVQCIGILPSAFRAAFQAVSPNSPDLWKVSDNLWFDVDEGITWIRGHYRHDAPEIAALKAAYALGGTPSRVGLM